MQVQIKSELDPFSNRLIRVSELDALLLSSTIVTDITIALQSTRDYLYGFLNRPHPHLGREGPVCPFIGGAIKKDTLLLYVYNGELLEDKIIEKIVDLCSQFLTLCASPDDDKMYRSIIVLFPKLSEDSVELIDRIQASQKSGFVNAGLMLGQFHGRVSAPGVRNPEFRPLRSAIPMLVIRNMVSGDLVFLDSNPAHFRAYAQRFPRDTLPSFLQERFDRVAMCFSENGRPA